MKKTTIILMVLAFLSISTSAFAGPYINDVYMTDANGSFAKQSVINPITYPSTTDVYGNYGWNDTPWIYIDLNSAVTSYTISWWKSESDPSINPSSFTFNNTGATDIWQNISNWTDPSGPRTAGWWDVRVDYSEASGGIIDAQTTKFHVTAAPEPLSAALFLIGGAGLVVARRRKK